MDRNEIKLREFILKYSPMSLPKDKSDNQSERTDANWLCKMRLQKKRNMDWNTNLDQIAETSGFINLFNPLRKEKTIVLSNQELEIVERYKETKNQGNVAAHYNISRASVQRILKKHGIETITDNIKGELNSQSKLNSSDVIDIKNRLKNGETQSSIAKIYNVSQYCISLISQKKAWQ